MVDRIGLIFMQKGDCDMDVAAIIVAVISAAGIPTALTGLFIRRLEKKLDKKEEAREKRRETAEKNRQTNEAMIIKGIGAAIALSEATAAAVQRIPDAHCNGDMHEALEYARKVKHQHKDFLYEKAVESIVE